MILSQLIDIVMVCNFIKKNNLTQLFSCEFCEVFKNTFFTEHLWTTASSLLKVFTEAIKIIKHHQLKINDLAILLKS